MQQLQCVCEQLVLDQPAGGQSTIFSSTVRTAAPSPACSAHPVKVAGVAVLPLGRQVLAQTRSLPHQQKGDGHEERRDIVRFQQPFVDLRQVVQKSTESCDQTHVGTADSPDHKSRGAVTAEGAE